MDESRCRIHIKPALGHIPIKEIGAAVLNDFRDTLVKKGLSVATIRHCFVLIRQVFNHHITMGTFAGPNPISKASMPKSLREKMVPNKIDNQRLRFLSRDEVEALLDDLKRRSPTTHDIALLSLRTGARFDEIVSLQGQHVDVFNGVIHFFGKNGKTRQAHMTPDIQEMFKTRIPSSPSGYIFESTKGGKIPQVSKAFWNAIKDLGLNEGVTDSKQRVVFHTLRHTFGSWLAQQGTSLFVIKDLMGHETIEMTMRYAHLLPDTKRDAVMALFQETTSDKVIRLADRTQNAHL